MLSKLIALAALAALCASCRSAANQDRADPKPPRSSAEPQSSPASADQRPSPASAEQRSSPAPATSLAILAPSEGDALPATGMPSTLGQADGTAQQAAPVPRAPPQAQPSRTPRIVLVVGDSLSDTRAGGGGYLRPITERCLGASVHNRARGGFMVNQMRRRFEKELSPRALARYTDLIVFGGVNDLYSDISASRTFDKITADLTKMYRAAEAAGVRVIAITVAPWAGFERHFTPARGAATRRLNDWIHAQRATGLVDVVIDAHSLLSCGDPGRICPEYDRTKSDGLHFGAKGHERLGAALLDRAFPECKSGEASPLRRSSER